MLSPRSGRNGEERDKPVWKGVVKILNVGYGAGWLGSTCRRDRWRSGNGESLMSLSLPRLNLQFSLLYDRVVEQILTQNLIRYREYVGEMETRQWKIGFALLTSLFNPPPSDANHKTLQHALNTLRPKRGKAEPLSESEMERWFSYDSFLELLGLANLNQEDSGGLYALHAHLNHNCEPNIMVKSLPS